MGGYEIWRQNKSEDSYYSKLGTENKSITIFLSSAKSPHIIVYACQVWK